MCVELYSEKKMAEKYVKPSVTDHKISEYLDSRKNKTLQVMICGCGGIGKSTLTDCLFNESVAETGRHGGATTTVVSKHEHENKRGLKVCLFDTPGFGDVRMTNDYIAMMMRKETNNEVHLVFYCIMLDGQCRVMENDERALQTLILFSNKVWENTVIVLTFANEL